MRSRLGNVLFGFGNKLVRSQSALNFGGDTGERLRERGGIFAAPFSHIRTAPAFATYGLSERADEFAGLDFHQGEQCTLARHTHKYCRAQHASDRVKSKECIVRRS